MSIKQRVRDWVREREIDRLAKGCAEAYESGDRAKAGHFYHAMRRAISRRSPGQIGRMERSRGLR